jgi:hypothetical protein
MSEASGKRWFGVRRQAVLIAFGVIAAVELPLVILARNSTIPYLWYWTSDDAQWTVVRAYWDGRIELTDYPRTGWTLLAAYGIFAGLAATILVLGYWTVRWLKRSGLGQISPGRLSAWVVAAAILFASATALAIFIER